MLPLPIVSEILYTSEPVLRHPLRFFSNGVSDVRKSAGVAWQLFRRNLQVRHRRAWLGYAWLLLPTVGTTLVWVYVQSRRIVNIGPTGLPYPVYVLAGTVLWQVFVDALNAPLQQLAAGKQMITRSRVPHEALVLSGLYEALFNAAVRLIVLAAVLVAYRIPMRATILFVPIGIAALALLGLTLGLLAAPLGMLYDDVSRAIVLLTTFWFFLTPVIYPAAASGLLRLNPVTPLLESTRSWMTSGATSMSGELTLVTLLTVPALLLAWVFYRLARPHVVARLG